jgi:tripartite-type tricarboxylate transporter receptor subunit TctC
MKNLFMFLLLLVCGQIYAQDSDRGFPDRPITIVVPAGAGGTTDVLARVLGEKIGVILKQPIIIDNKPGASGIIGSSAVARAKPNGYTLLMTFPSHVINPSVKQGMPYNTVKDFSPITKIGSVSAVLLINKDIPAKTLQDFVKLAKTKQDEMNYGSVGIGSWGNLAMLLFESKVGLSMMGVVYKGDPELMTALISGDIHSAFVSPITALPFIKAGKVRALAIADPERLASISDIPTVAELGYKGFSATSWNGIFGPANMSKEVVSKLNLAINEALKDPSIQKQFREQGVKPLGGSPESLQQSLEQDIETYGKALKFAGVEPS